MRSFTLRTVIKEPSLPKPVIDAVLIEDEGKLNARSAPAVPSTARRDPQLRAGDIRLRSGHTNVSAVGKGIQVRRHSHLHGRFSEAIRTPFRDNAP